MKRALLILFLTATAHAQPAWDPDRGWNIDDDPGMREVERMRAEHARRFEEAQRDIDATKRKMDEDFKRDRWAMFLPFGAVFVAVAIGGALSAGQRRRRRFEYVPVVEAATERVAYQPPGTVDVTVLRFGVDASSGKFISGELERLTKQINDRAQLLREVGLALRRARAGWLYGGAVNEPLRSLGEAKAVFAKHIDEARLKGESTTGSGIVVITVVVAARGELMTVDNIDAEHMRRALEAAAYREATDIVDIGVVTTRCPSVAELETQYPRPHLVPLTAVGTDKTFCTYCGAPVPLGLVACSSCGAPARR